MSLADLTPVDDPRLRVLEGPGLGPGALNTDEATIARHIRHAIRLGHPQVQRKPSTYQTIALVGSGPSLAATLPALRDCLFAGAQLVTLNGAHQWAIDHQFHPKAQVVLDARASNARFLSTAVPRCHTYVASQCHPDTWAQVQDRPDTYIFHAVSDGAHATILDQYYGLRRWLPVTGGVTVATRALTLFRLGGFHRFELFGIDSCWLEGAHHAFDQPENAADRAITVQASPSGHPALARTFTCAPWHLKQAEDFLQQFRVNGHHFQLRAHGDGLIAHLVASLAHAHDVDLHIKE